MPFTSIAHPPLHIYTSYPQPDSTHTTITIKIQTETLNTEHPPAREIVKLLPMIYTKIDHPKKEPCR